MYDLDGFVEHEDGSFSIDISSRDQFEAVVRCVQASISYRSITKMFTIFGELIGNMKLGKPSELMVRTYVRYLVAINLTALIKIVLRAWVFRYGGRRNT